MTTQKATKTKPETVLTLPCGRPLPQQKTEEESSSSLLKRIVVQLNKYCVENKLNRSEAREKILDVAVNGSRHFTALELLERLQKRFPEIGKATLYRNLPVLVESSVLQEGPHDANGQITYELAGTDHHDHIVCQDCKRIFEFHDEVIEKRQEKISESMNFTPRDHHHVVYASCNFLKIKKNKITKNN